MHSLKSRTNRFEDGAQRAYSIINNTLNVANSSMHDIGLSTTLYIKILKDMLFHICIPQI